MGPPTLFQHVRQTLGRALRETGQALDRVGVKVASLAVTPHEFYDDPVIYEDHLSRHRHQFPLLNSGRPVVHPQAAYLAPCATLIGSVRIGKGSSVWYGAILRGDDCENAESFNKTDEDLLEYSTRTTSSSDEKIDEWELDDDRFTERLDRYGGAIQVGENTNIQDNCIVTAKMDHCKIGNGVTVGHLAQIHSATIEDFCLIGMGSIINEGARIESESFIGAGAVIPAGTVVKSGELWIGNPARKLRDLTAEQRQRLHYQSSEYVGVATEQQGVMQLGGNLTESMLDQHAETALEAGNEDDKVERVVGASSLPPLPEAEEEVAQARQSSR